MRFLFTLSLLLPGSFTIAQSPAYNIVLQLKDTVTPYSIEMKFCKPKQQTRFKDWFAHDTSKINWEKLKPAGYTCGDYLTGETFDNKRPNSFKSANQAMVWENVLVFKITSRFGNSKPMYILVPIFIQSFVTSVAITDVPFKPGIYELDKLITNIDGMRITMQNNKEQTWVDHEKVRKFKVELD
jgi:hypothetical protein